MSLTRDDILGAQDLDKERVEVPEWGGHVWIRELSASERDAWEAEIVAREDKGLEAQLQNVRARLLVRVLVDKDGKRLFADKDADALGEKSGAAVGRLFERARRKSAITEEEVEELAGN